MSSTVSEIAAKTLRKKGGTLRTSEVLRLGIHPRTLYQLREDGRVIQLSRGVYRLADLPLPENGDLITVAKRVPSGVICLISALSFHGITNEVPHEIYLAVARGKERPKLDFPPVRVFHFSPASFDAGIETHKVPGGMIKVYSKEKTVADCFKFRNRIGLDVSIEALRQCLRKGGSRKKILEYARICRVEKIIRPYLEAIE